MRKAVINNTTREVENIIEYADRGIAIRLPLGYTVQDCTDTDVQIGDTFEDGAFLRGGEPVETVPSNQARLAQLETALAVLAGEDNQ